MNSFSKRHIGPNAAERKEMLDTINLIGDENNE